MFQKLFNYAVRILFPADTAETEISGMRADQFLTRAPRRHNDTIVKRPLVLAPFVYRDPLVKTAVHLAKYRNKKGVCRMLGEALWDIYGEDISSRALLSGTRWTVIPVPLSSRKKRMRGYNQSEEIARGFLARADADMFLLDPTLLSKTADRGSQTKTVSKTERKRNARDSFFVPKTDTVARTNIILLDDVVTTGATLTDAARTLKKAGARRILCIAVAH